MPNYRCKYNQIWDSNTKRYRNCKNKKFENFCYCAYHSKKIFNKYVIKIQKIYKGYYIRKKLKIYYNLPRDLQRKIIWHINTNLYVKQFNSSISKIIYKRYKTFYDNLTYRQYINQFFYNNLIHPYVVGNLHFYISIDNDFINDLLSIIKLTFKYLKIINTSKILILNKLQYISKVLFLNKYIYYDINNHKLLHQFSNIQ